MLFPICGVGYRTSPYKNANFYLNYKIALMEEKYKHDEKTDRKYADR